MNANMSDGDPVQLFRRFAPAVYCVRAGYCSVATCRGSRYSPAKKRLARLLTCLESLLERPLLIISPGIGQQPAGEARTSADTCAQRGVSGERSYGGASRRTERRTGQRSLLARRQIGASTE